MFTLPIIFAAINYKLVAMVAAPVAAGAVGALLIRGDTRVENRRKRAAELAALAGENGLPLTKGMLTNYAAGDYSGLLGSVDALYDELTDDTRRRAALEVFLAKQLEKRLGNNELSDGLMAAIEKQKPGAMAAFLAKTAAPKAA